MVAVETAAVVLEVDDIPYLRQSSTDTSNKSSTDTSNLESFSDGEKPSYFVSVILKGRKCIEKSN